jgi:hypothetical protein
MLKHLLRRVLVLCALLAVPFSQTHAFASIIRVKTTGSDVNSGSDWGQAKKTISAAITAAAQGDQIWVAAGTYPEHIANKVINDLSVDVALYGGFAGSETQLEQREYASNITIIDGTASGFVVSITHNAGPGMRVDGFTITNGTVRQMQPSGGLIQECGLCCRVPIPAAIRARNGAGPATYCYLQ